MDKYKRLYKENSALLDQPQRHRIKLSNLVKEKRIKQRSDNFWNNRNIVTPLRDTKKPLILVTSENLLRTNGSPGKKNAKTLDDKQTKDDDESMSEESRHHITQIFTDTNKFKTKRQEAYLKRLLNWKATRKIEERKQFKPPFVVGTCKSNGTNSLAFINPKFRAHMKDQEISEKRELRKSFYTVVPTPPRITTPMAELRKVKIRKPQFVENLNSAAKEMNTSNADILNKNSKLKNVAPLNREQNVKNKPLPSNTLSLDRSKLLNNITSYTSVNQNTKEVPLQMIGVSAVSPGASPNAYRLRTRNVSKKKVLVPVSDNAANIKDEPNLVPSKLISLSNLGTNGAVGKAKLLLKKRAKVAQLPHANSNLTVNFKSKKPMKFGMLASSQTAKLISNIITNTPIEYKDSVKPYDNFVTSTQIKTSAADRSKKLNDISDMFNVIKKPKNNIAVVSSQSSSVKRRLLANKASPQRHKSRFNFVNVTEIERSFIASPVMVDGDSRKILQEQRLKNQHTPKCSTVSVNIKKSTRPDQDFSKEEENKVVPHKTQLLQEPDLRESLVENRNNLDIVQQFRMQVSIEIQRLHALCDTWNVYKEENLELLKETGGDDMINMTIGQTKLLTSKKFAQFSGLIARCEAGIKSGVNVTSDGSEDTKPITAIDLEGFWSMVGLQIDNVEKRFKDLERWKRNDWLDPDAVQVKVKKSANNVKKLKVKKEAVKVKASSGLQSMLRQKYAETRMKRANVEELDDNCTNAFAITVEPATAENRLVVVKENGESDIKTTGNANLSLISDSKNLSQNEAVQMEKYDIVKSALKSLPPINSTLKTLTEVTQKSRNSLSTPQIALPASGNVHDLAEMAPEIHQWRPRSKASENLAKSSVIISDVGRVTPKNRHNEFQLPTNDVTLRLLRKSSTAGRTSIAPSEVLSPEFRDKHLAQSKSNGSVSKYEDFHTDKVVQRRLSLRSATIAQSSTSGTRLVTSKCKRVMGASGANSPGWVTIKVMDRKQNSPVPTIVTIPKLANRRLAEKKLLPTSPMVEDDDNRAIDTLENSLSQPRADAAVRYTLTELKSPLYARNELKSILKTPASVRGKSKSVIFNQKLHIKSFTLNEDEDDN